MITRRSKKINRDKITVENFQQLEDTILSLCNDLIDLRLHFHLIIGAFTEPDITLPSDEPFYYSVEDRNEKMQFLLSLFCSRFGPKDIRDMSDKAEEIHKLFAQILED
jgi:hypothetical protein